MSKFKSILSSGTENIEDTEISTKKESFLEKEYKKSLLKRKLIFALISISLIAGGVFVYQTYKEQINLMGKRIYIFIFGFDININDYKIDNFEKLTFWGKILYLKDIKSLHEMYKYYPEKFNKSVKEYQKIWLNLLKTKNLELFKKQYAKFWGIESIFESINKQKVDKKTFHGNYSSGKNFTGDILTGNNFAKDTLTGNVLTGNKLSENTLSGDNLTGTILTGDGFSGNVLPESNFVGDNLSGDNLPENILTGNSLSGGIFTGNNFSGELLPGEKPFKNNEAKINKSSK